MERKSDEKLPEPKQPLEKAKKKSEYLEKTQKAPNQQPNRTKQNPKENMKILDTPISG